MVRPAPARADPVRYRVPGLHRDLPAPCERYIETVVLSVHMTRAFAITLNALGLYAIALALAVAFGAQLLLHELPCPLCLLQRIAFTVLAVGAVLDNRHGTRAPSLR